MLQSRGFFDHQVDRPVYLKGVEAHICITERDPGTNGKDILKRLHQAGYRYALPESSDLEVTSIYDNVVMHVIAITRFPREGVTSYKRMSDKLVQCVEDILEETMATNLVSYVISFHDGSHSHAVWGHGSLPCKGRTRREKVKIPAGWDVIEGDLYY